MGFNPTWQLEPKYPMESSCDISDDFMGKVAVSMDYKWDFNKDIYEEIQKQEEEVHQLQLRLKDKNKEYNLILEIIKIYQPKENPDDIIKGLKINLEFNEKSLYDALEKLNNLKKVVEVRNNLYRR